MDRSESFPMFVYGTLMLGERNHAEVLRKNLLYYIKAEIQGQLYYYDEEDFPALTVGRKKIKGQLFYFDSLDDVLQFTHKLEGYIAPDHKDNMYHFEIAQVVTEANEIVQAFVYRINPQLLSSQANKFSVIEEDSWKTFKNR